MLPDWIPGQPLPVALGPLQHGLACWERSLVPADAKALAVAVKALTTFATAFRIPVPDDAGLVAVYIETLRDLPSDLVLVAVERVKRAWHWRTMPLPGDIRATIDAEITERKRQRGRHDLALKLIAKQDAHRRAMAHERELERQRMAADPIVVKPREPVIHSPDDAGPEVDLGDTAARMRQWAAANAN